MEECTQFPFRCPNRSFGLEIGGHRDKVGNYRNALLYGNEHGEGGDLFKSSKYSLDPKQEPVSITGVSYTSTEQRSALTQLQTSYDIIATGCHSSGF